MPFSDTFLLRRRLALSPWFSEEALSQGQEQLQGAVRLFYRQSCGVLLADGVTSATVSFSRNSRTTQGFALKDAFCSTCSMQSKPPFCSHLAVATLAALVPDPGQGGQPFPAPLLFADSFWAEVARHLYNQWHKSQMQLQEAANGCLQLVIANEKGEQAVCLTLPASQSPLLRAKVSGHKDQRLAALQAEQQKLGASKTEAELNRQGMSSVGQRQDSSLLFLVSGLLASRLAVSDLSLSRRHDRLLLSGHSQDQRYGLHLQLPVGNASQSLLQAASASLSDWPLSPQQAHEFSRLQLLEDGSLLVTPCLRLGDGRTFKRAELAATTYGNLLHLEDEGLYPICRQEEQLAIRPPQPKRANLFDFASPGLKPEQPCAIPASEAATFLKKHRQALQCPDNDIDPRLQELRLIEMPQCLTIEQSSHDEQGWYYISGHYGVGSKEVPLLEVLEALHQKRDYLPGSGLLIKDSPLAWLNGLGEENLWQQGGEVVGLRLNSPQLLRLTSQVNQVELATDCTDTRLHSLLNAASWQDTTLLSHHPGHLRSYQVNGLAWLASLYRHGLGGILADDMGLGKTHQALALIWLICQEEKQARFLVVCPATVVSHWAMKAEDFYEELRVQVFHGVGRKIDADSQLVITTYGLLGRDPQLQEHHFNAIIFDEMQQLKNKKTLAHQAAHTLATPCRIGLSGTPIENSSLDLKALLDLCLPGLLEEDRQFSQRYGGRPSPERLEELARRISPFILRRERRQVLKELPEIIDDLHTCELTEEQVALYRQAIGQAGEELQEALQDDTARLDYSSVLTLVTRLKQICNHPALLDPATPYSSGKWELFKEILAESLAASMKVVVFSQYTAMLDIIENYLHQENIGHASLHGAMSVKKRAAMIARFQQEDDCQVFCASLLAGGVGVDLTAAQVVIHYDRWWNAAREDQATARVHRMGQKKVVQVCRLVTSGTLEEKIHRLIDQRRELAAQLIRQDDASLVKGLSRQDLRDLLSWQA